MHGMDEDGASVGLKVRDVRVNECIFWVGIVLGDV